MESKRRSDERIAAEAADWFLQFHDNADRPVDHAAFAEWLTRSPAHVEEFLEVSALWSTIGMSGSSGYRPADLIAAAKAERARDKVVQLDSPPGLATYSSSGRARRRGMRRWMVATAASLFVGLAVWLAFVTSRWGTEYATTVGEQRSITLADGSVVFLNTDSGVRVRFGKVDRHIDLLRGEARFQVASDPRRPFVVATTDAMIRALGTIFNVAMDHEGTQVAVIEGRVELRERAADAAEHIARTAPPPDSRMDVALLKKRHSRIELAAGQRAAVTAQGIEPDVGASIDSVNAWTQRRLVLRDRTLAEVVLQFNRYRRQPLVVDDPALAGLRVSGTFDLSDPESLLTYLGTVESVQVRTLHDGSVHLSRGHR